MDGTLGLYETNFFDFFLEFLRRSVGCRLLAWVTLGGKNGRVRANEERPIVKFVAIFSGRYNFLPLLRVAGERNFDFFATEVNFFRSRCDFFVRGGILFVASCHRDPKNLARRRDFDSQCPLKVQISAKMADFINYI